MEQKILVININLKIFRRYKIQVIDFLITTTNNRHFDNFPLIMVILKKRMQFKGINENQFTSMNQQQTKNSIFLLLDQYFSEICNFIFDCNLNGIEISFIILYFNGKVYNTDMTQRRVLPARSTRGKRNEQTLQQIEKEDELYNKIIEAVNNEVIGLVKEKENISKKADSSHIQLQYKQHLITNKMFFPYSRGYHYFFDLTSFPRVDGSISYSFDQNNVFKSNYSKDHLIIKDNLTVGQILNRKIFGLPIAENVIIPKTKDKNICHNYLFHNQDRKYQIDRNLYEYRQILLNFDQFVRTGKINQFICLKKEVDLFVIFQDNVSNDEKKNLLANKIKMLEQKKQSMEQFILNQDKNFYYHSLNQKLHDEIQQMSSFLNHDLILGEISYAEYIREELKGCHQFKGAELSKLFKYDQTEQNCLSEECLRTISQKIGPSFFNKIQNENIFQLSLPFIFISLTNPMIMQISQKILSLKLANQSQASYYLCKSFWRRIFNRDLTLNKQIKQMTKFDYDRLMNQTMIQLHKWKKLRQKQHNNQIFEYPHLDNLINWNSFEGESKKKDLFCLEKSVQITARQFICIVLFYRLYLCISEIYQFILNNENISVLIAHDYYSKAHNYVVQCIGTARFGILDQVLKRLTQWIIRSDFKVDFLLKLVYNQSYGVVYVVKTGIERDQKLEKQNIQNGYDQDDNEISETNEKKIKIN